MCKQLTRFVEREAIYCESPRFCESHCRVNYNEYVSAMEKRTSATKDFSGTVSLRHAKNVAIHTFCVILDRLAPSTKFYSVEWSERRTSLRLPCGAGPDIVAMTSRTAIDAHAAGTAQQPRRRPSQTP
jgi:hypothetical protein